MSLPWPEPDEEPEGKVSPAGWGWYHVNVHAGITCYREGWLVFGRSRAEKKARREVRRWKLNEARARQEWTVT